MNIRGLLRTVTQPGDADLPAPKVPVLDQIRESQVDFMTRFYKANPDVEDARQRMTLAYNKAGEGFEDLQPLNDVMRMVQDRGLTAQTRKLLETDQSLHTYATNERHYKDKISEYYQKLGSGDTHGARFAKSEADQLRQRIDTNEIVPEGLHRGDIDRVRSEVLDSLSEDDQQVVLNARERTLKLGERLPEVLEGIASPETLAAWRANAQEAPYLHAARKEGVVTQDPDTLDLFLQQPHRDMMENVQRRGVSASSLDPILKRMEASDKTEFDDPVASQAKIYERAQVERARQGAAKEALAIMREQGHSVREIDAPDSVGKLEGVISYVEGGKVKHFAVDGDLADIVNIGGGTFVSDALSVLGKVQRMQSRMITSWNLGFALRNVPKDLGDTLTNVKEISNPFDVGKFMYLWGKTIQQEALGEGMYAAKRDFYKRGGGLSNLQAQLSDSRFGNNLTTTQRGWFSRKFDNIENLQSSLEVAPKIAVYRFLTEVKDMDPDKAAYIARTLAGSPDFGRKGRAATQMMGLIQFWNPQVQGIARLATVVKDPKALGMIMAKFTAGYMALDAYNNSFTYTDTDGTERREIERVPAIERQNNLIFMVPDVLSGYEQKGETTSKGRSQRSYLKLPLGHGVKFFLNPIMDAFAKINGEEFAPSLGDMALRAAGNVLPSNVNIDPKEPAMSVLRAVGSGVNPLIRYPAEELANKYFYLDIPIEGQRVEKLDPKYRYTPATSELAKRFAAGADKVVPGFAPLTSPERVDHLMRTLAPGVGEVPLSIVSSILEKYKPNEGPQATRLEKIAKAPVFGPMLRSLLPSGGDERRTQYSKNLYAAQKSTAAAVGTVNKLLSDGNEDEARAYYAANRERIEGNKAINHFVRELSEVSKYEQQVLNSNLAPAEKTRRMKLAYDTKLNLLSQAQPIAKALR